MTNDAKVKAALMQAALDFLTGADTINTASGPVADLPTLPGDSISWENRNFDPAGKSTWASVFYVPTIPTARTIGRGGIDEISGFIQIDLNTQPNNGDGTHESWNEKARLFFESGRGFTYQTQSVLVISCGMSQGRNIENFYRKSITVAFRSQLKRPQTTN